MEIASFTSEGVSHVRKFSVLADLKTEFVNYSCARSQNLGNATCQSQLCSINYRSKCKVTDLKMDKNLCPHLLVFREYFDEVLDAVIKGSNDADTNCFKDKDISTSNKLDAKEGDQEEQFIELVRYLSQDLTPDPGLPEGVPSLCSWSGSGLSLDTSETVHYFFLILCMELGYHKGTKVTELLNISASSH